VDKTAGRAAGVQETGDGGVESGAVLLNMGFYADQIGAVTGLLKSRMIVDRRKESMQHDIGCNHPPVGHRFGKIFYGECYRREDACPMQSQDLPEKNGKHNTKQREPALPAGLLGIKKKTAENEKKGATKNNFGIIVALHDEDSGLFTVE
jgi:hypothetical protein